MGTFQQKVEAELIDLFDPTSEERREIKQIAEQANQLRSALERQENQTINLTVDSIVEKMEERADGGPKWAWNNWIGTAVAFGLVPEGYQVKA